jgi:predicted transcriptional regulator
MTLTLELTDDLQQQLEALARARQSSAEEVAIQALRESLSSEAVSRWSSTAVRDAAQQVITEDAELLRRLAQ